MAKPGPRQWKPWLGSTGGKQASEHRECLMRRCQRLWKIGHWIEQKLTAQARTALVANPQRSHGREATAGAVAVDSDPRAVPG